MRWATRLAPAAVVAVPLLGVAAPAHAVEAACAEVTTRDVDSSPVSGPSRPFDLLAMDAAIDRVDRFAPGGRPPVRVAVIDTGVQTQGGAIPVRAVQRFATGEDGIEDGGGTEVAGLVAGRSRPDDAPVGFAPEAEIVDVQVAVVRAGDPDQVTLTAARVADGLEWVADHAGPLNIQVATVAYPVGPDDGLRAAVRAAQEAGVVVVAATGDRPDDGSDGSDGSSDGDEPTAAGIRPAGYPGVVGVNATAGGMPGGVATEYVLASASTTVAVPTYAAVSYAINGRTCVVTEPSTSAATAEVAGIVALLRQRFPHDTPPQTVARLVNTASGTTDDPTPLTGAGIVQPLEALTRPLAPAEDGTVERSEPVAGPQGPVSPPTTPTDLLASTRENAVWWTLIGGGLVVVALLLRPVLARRRP